LFQINIYLSILKLFQCTDIKNNFLNKYIILIYFLKKNIKKQTESNRHLFGAEYTFAMAFIFESI
jgi:hypothetical protein